MRFKEDRVVTIEATGESESPTPTRRDFLYVATGAAAAVGMFASLFPMIDQMEPDASTLAAGGPVDFDLSKLQPSQQRSCAGVRDRYSSSIARQRHSRLFKTHNCWRNCPTRVLAHPSKPPYPDNSHRSIKREYSVLVGICTHLGCIPMFYPDPSDSLPTRNWLGGYFCPCHGSKYDLAGRVFNGVPAPYNLPVPPDRLVNDEIIRIGENPPDVNWDFASVAQI
jgi:ubiquinol-cytochrome c reductase iron-sulfur subunit